MSIQEASKVGRSGGQTPLAPDDHRHGTVNGYVNRGCRCERCQKAISQYQRDRRKPCVNGCGNLVYVASKTWTHRGYTGLRTGLCRTCLIEKRRRASEVPHGTESRYTGFHKCRCDLCRAAATEAKRMRRQRTGAKAA